MTRPSNVDAEHHPSYDPDTPWLAQLPGEKIIACGHFWGVVLIIMGITGVIIDVLLTHQVGLLAGFGFIAILAGIGGLSMNAEESGGGRGTGAFVLFSVIILGMAMWTFYFRLGTPYLWPSKARETCASTEGCNGPCRLLDCACWEDDRSTTCDNGTSARYCYSFHGDCANIKEEEDLLIASTGAFFLTLFASLCALVVSSGACCCCYRAIVEEAPRARRVQV